MLHDLFVYFVDKMETGNEEADSRYESRIFNSCARSTAWVRL